MRKKKCVSRDLYFYALRITGYGRWASTTAYNFQYTAQAIEPCPARLYTGRYGENDSR